MPNPFVVEAPNLWLHSSIKSFALPNLLVAVVSAVTSIVTCVTEIK